MKLQSAGYLAGIPLVCIGAAMLPALFFSLRWQDGAAGGIAWAVLCTMLAGGFLTLRGKKARKNLFSRREALAAVGLCWLSAGIAGALPFLLSHRLGFAEAFFESVSGFTTTGATILTNIESLPASLLLWRSMTQWLGGMGIIVLSLAILPHLAVGGMQLYIAEVPGPNKDKLTPRMRDTAKTLWIVYGALTLLMALALRLAGMSWYDAANHSLTTLATGGFSTRNASMGAFSPLCQWIVIAFMLAAGLNFSLHCRFLRGAWNAYGKDEECRAFLWLNLSCAAVVLALLCFRDAPESFSLAWLEQRARGALFQVVSLCTSTGFATENYAEWPAAACPVLLFVMFAGGCAGSTAGGFKIVRLLLLGKMLLRRLFLTLHQHAIRPVRLQNQSVPADVLEGIIDFLLIFLAALSLFTFIIMLFDIDFLTAFSTVLTCISNVGPGLGRFGPADNGAWFPDALKIILSCAMLLGRLEFYAIVIMFVPEFWKK